jgi:hypothetical protein
MEKLSQGRKDMTQTIREPNPSTAQHDTTAPPSAGVAFVPCAICLAPVDLARMATGDAQLCDRHGLAAFVPLA